MAILTSYNTLCTALTYPSSNNIVLGFITISLNVQENELTLEDKKYNAKVILGLDDVTSYIGKKFIYDIATAISINDGVMIDYGQIDLVSIVDKVVASSNLYSTLIKKMHFIQPSASLPREDIIAAAAGANLGNATIVVQDALEIITINTTALPVPNTTQTTTVITGISIRYVNGSDPTTDRAITLASSFSKHLGTTNQDTSTTVLVDLGSTSTVIVQNSTTYYASLCSSDGLHIHYALTTGLDVISPTQILSYDCNYNITGDAGTLNAIDNIDPGQPSYSRADIKLAAGTVTPVQLSYVNVLNLVGNDIVNSGIDFSTSDFVEDAEININGGYGIGLYNMPSIPSIGVKGPTAVNVSFQNNVILPNSSISISLASEDIPYINISSVPTVNITSLASSAVNNLYAAVATSLNIFGSYSLSIISALPSSLTGIYADQNSGGVTLVSGSNATIRGGSGNDVIYTDGNLNNVLAADGNDIVNSGSRREESTLPNVVIVNNSEWDGGDGIDTAEILINEGETEGLALKNFEVINLYPLSSHQSNLSFSDDSNFNSSVISVGSENLNSVSLNLLNLPAIPSVLSLDVGGDFSLAYNNAVEQAEYMELIVSTNVDSILLPMTDSVVLKSSTEDLTISSLLLSNGNNLTYDTANTDLVIESLTLTSPHQPVGVMEGYIEYIYNNKAGTELNITNFYYPQFLSTAIYVFPTGNINIGHIDGSLVSSIVVGEGGGTFSVANSTSEIASIQAASPVVMGVLESPSDLSTVTSQGGMSLFDSNPLSLSGSTADIAIGTLQYYYAEGGGNPTLQLGGNDTHTYINTLNMSSYEDTEFTFVISSDADSNTNLTVGYLYIENNVNIRTEVATNNIFIEKVISSLWGGNITLTGSANLLIGIDHTISNIDITGYTGKLTLFGFSNTTLLVEGDQTASLYGIGNIDIKCNTDGLGRFTFGESHRYDLNKITINGANRCDETVVISDMPGVPVELEINRKIGVTFEYADGINPTSDPLTVSVGVENHSCPMPLTLPKVETVIFNTDPYALYFGGLVNLTDATNITTIGSHTVDFAGGLESAITNALVLNNQVEANFAILTSPAGELHFTGSGDATVTAVINNNLDSINTEDATGVTTFTGQVTMSGATVTAGGDLIFENGLVIGNSTLDASGNNGNTTITGSLYFTDNNSGNFVIELGGQMIVDTFHPHNNN